MASFVDKKNINALYGRIHILLEHRIYLILRVIMNTIRTSAFYTESKNIEAIFN